MKTHYKIIANEKTENSIRPETALLYAVLERAILDAKGIKTNTYGDTARNTALQWLFEEHKEFNSQAFTFPWICEHLNACPKLTRKRIFKYLSEETGTWGGRTTWQNIAKLLTDEVPSVGDYGLYYQASEVESLDEEL